MPHIGLTIRLNMLGAAVESDDLALRSADGLRRKSSAHISMERVGMAESDGPFDLNARAETGKGAGAR